MCAYTLSHLHHPSPHTNILASLVKGEVLSPEKIRATTGGLPHQPFQNRTIPSLFAMLTSVCADTLSHPHHPSPHTNILASLVKGEVLSPEKLATTGGIAAPTLSIPTTLSKPHPSLAPHHVLASLVKVRCCRPKKFGRLPEGLPHRPSPSPQPSQNPIPLIKTHHHSPFSPRVSPQLLLRFPHRQPRRRPTRNRICSSARRSAPLCLASPAFQPF